MTMKIDCADDGSIRLEFRRKGKDGKKPNPILWTVAPAMRCFMTDFVVLYGLDVRRIWCREPGELVLCDRYAYDKETDTHQFYFRNELQCRLQGGAYGLPMHEFMLTAIRDHPDAGTAQPQ